MKEKFFAAAREECRKSEFVGSCSAHVGAVAVFRGRVIARGHNQNKTHPLQYEYNRFRFDTNSTHHYFPSFIHAEITVISKIRNLDINFNEVIIYIYRELRDGSIATARPCASCYNALRDLGIRRVCYTTENGFCEERYGD